MHYPTAYEEGRKAYRDGMSHEDGYTLYPGDALEAIVWRMAWKDAQLLERLGIQLMEREIMPVEAHEVHLLDDPPEYDADRFGNSRGRKGRDGEPGTSDGDGERVRQVQRAAARPDSTRAVAG